VSAGGPAAFAANFRVSDVFYGRRSGGGDRRRIGLVDFGPDVDADRAAEIDDRERDRDRLTLRDRDRLLRGSGVSRGDSIRSALSSPETVISSVSDYTSWSCASPRSPNHVEFSYRPPPSFVPRIRLEALRSPRRGVDDYVLSPDPAKSISTLYSPRSAFTPRSNASNDDASTKARKLTGRPGE